MTKPKPRAGTPKTWADVRPVRQREVLAYFEGYARGAASLQRGLDWNDGLAEMAEAHALAALALKAAAKKGRR